MDAHPDTPRGGHDQSIIRFKITGPVATDGCSPLRVLIVSERTAWARNLRRILGERGVESVCVRSAAAARAAIRLGANDNHDDLPDAIVGDRRGAIPARSSESAPGHAYDAMLTDCALPDGDGLSLCLFAGARQIPAIVVAKRASIDLASCALQHGAADLLDRATPANPDVAQRILAVAQRSRNLRSGRSDEPRGLFRLRRPPGADNLHHDPQTGPNASDLLQAKPELVDHMKNVTTVSEFKGLIRGELDIEQLLRTTLEFVLARSGPTNAAVFLPTTSGDYSLGAYVNYDCPKDTCDVLLDHLANAVAPRFENVPGPGGMAHLTTREQLDEYLDGDADWLTGSHVVGFPCTHGNECLAIFMLFRDQRSPFQQPLLDQVKTVGELFAAQLARVIHIHHRHLPKNKWGMIGDPPAETDDYGDMAA